jgi:hypothetical protein
MADLWEDLLACLELSELGAEPGSFEDVTTHLVRQRHLRWLVSPQVTPPP